MMSDYESLHFFFFLIAQNRHYSSISALETEIFNTRNKIAHTDEEVFFADMRGVPYYELPEYHAYLLSTERKEIFPVDTIINQIRLSDRENVLDFGMGNGYFLLPIKQKMDPKGCLWGAECQELLIDATLQIKVKEQIENFIPFYIDRTEYPLLPDWTAKMDLIFCSCVLSTFANPTTALQGIGRSLTKEGSLIILDWNRVEAPSGPELAQKVSLDRMRYFIEDAGFSIIKSLKINPYIYGFEAKKSELFKEHEDDFRYLDY